jgi:DNA-directed RNA polymerase omega subunit
MHRPSFISSQNVVKQIGNRYDLVIVAANRARELVNNNRFDKPIGESLAVTALLDIEKGLVTRAYLSKTPPPVSRKSRRR